MAIRIFRLIALTFATYISILFAVRCDPSDNRLKIINDSNSDIYLFCACDSSLDDFKLTRNGYYSDSKGDSSYVMSSRFVKNKTSINISKRPGNDAWENFVENCPSQSLHIYFFIDSTAHSYSDREIKASKIYNKHNVMTLSELKQNNWTITFR